MRLRLLTATLLMVGDVGAPVRAIPDRHVHKSTLATLADRAVIDAMTAEREASARVRHYAAVTMIAEHDLQLARQQRALTADQWDAEPARADRWSAHHTKAVLDERVALSRVSLYRAERDLARVEFARAASDLERAVDQFERVVATLRATANDLEVA